MKNIFKKNVKWINGVLYVKYNELDEIVETFITISKEVGITDVDAMIDLAKAVEYNGLTFAIHVTTTEKIWNNLKKSGKVMKLVATKEKMAETSDEIGIVLA